MIPRGRKPRGVQRANDGAAAAAVKFVVVLCQLMLET
jgi:hypothetical protein